jgi:hypothetical protein
MSGGQHRGAGPEDAQLFGPGALPRLRAGATDLHWLLGRGYALPSALALVGNRHALDARQRLALQRTACSPDALRSRRSRELSPSAVRGRSLFLDGFNLVVTLEVALGGGVVLRGTDGCLRDLAGLRGSYHLVEETPFAIDALGACLARLEPERCSVLFDAPVSNSGRLRELLLERSRHWSVSVEAELVGDPDPILALRTGVASSDAMILDRCGEWANLCAWTVQASVPTAWMVDLGVDPPSQPSEL